jgi:FtsH-binding integral membrane protein
LAVTGSLAVTTISSFALLDPLVALISGALSSFYACYMISSEEPSYGRIHAPGGEYFWAQDSTFRKAHFGLLSVGMGLVITPVTMMCMATNPFILPSAVAASVGIFGSCAYVSTKVSDASMMSWKVPLSVGLTSLIVIQLSGIAAALFLGPNPYTALVHSVDMYGGLALFTGLAIYDNWAAVKVYQSGKPDHLLCATQLYLDFMNILIRIMEIMAKSKKH